MINRLRRLLTRRKQDDVITFNVDRAVVTVPPAVCDCEIERLAKYLMKYHGDRIGEEGRNESAVDVAIRLINEK